MRDIALMFILACSAFADENSPRWERSEVKDELRQTSSTQFVLRGKYLKEPRDARTDAVPAIVVRCKDDVHGPAGYRRNGRFIEGAVIMAGAVVDSQVVVRTGFFGTSFPTVVPVQYRLDNRKLETETWSISTDHSGAFFKDMTLNQFLYGHFMPHKEGTNDRVDKIIIGIDEAFAGEIQMQFDMPQDPTEIAETCGVIVHKKKGKD